MVAAGVAALVARSPLVMTMLTAVGAVYLVWLGITTLAHRSAPHAGAEQAPGSWVRQAARGMLFPALLPQFTHPDADWPLAVQMAVLGLVHVASCAVVYTGVGTGARMVLRARPAAARAVTRFSSAPMVVIAVLLLVEQPAG